MIEARSLSKRFHDKKRGDICAVENVSFTCRPGSIYGLLGANGAGKTTTLRMLATILEPYRWNRAGVWPRHRRRSGKSSRQRRLSLYRDGPLSAAYRAGNGRVFWAP